MATPRRAALSLAAVFFLLGVVGSSWVSRIPVVQDQLDLSNSTLGLALLAIPIGSVAASAVLPAVLARSTRAVLAVSMPAAAWSLSLLSAADSALALAAGLLLFGVTTGTVDVAMNAHAINVQQLLSRSAFGRWHAMWSAGGFVGAGAGALAVGGHVSATTQFTTVAAIVTLVTLPVVLGLGRSTHPQERTHRSWTTDRTVLLFATIALAGFVVEIAAADWGGVYLRRDLDAGSAAAAGAFAAFALPHFIVRMTGDPLISRWPARRLMISGLVVAAVGYVVIVSSPVSWSVLVGLAVAGSGVALVVPVAFAAAGNVAGVAPGAGVATAAGLSYVGWAATPPAVGAIAAAGDVRTGLLLPLVVALVVAAVATVRSV